MSNTLEIPAIKQSVLALERFKMTLKYAKEGLPFKGMVTYKDLSDIKLLDSTTIEGYRDTQIFSPKIHENEELMIFLTVLMPQQQFNGHEHDCPEEVYIVKGELADKMRKGKIKAGESMTYSKEAGHAPYNPSSTEETILIVTFTNPYE